jgi:hypothetical protein
MDRAGDVVAWQPMARVTAEALDDAQLRLLAARRAPRLPPVRLAPVGSFLSLALLVGGAGAIVASDLVPRPLVLLAVVAVALGGWLARGAQPPSLPERAVVDRERQDVIRAALAIGLRGNDAVVELARRERSQPATGQPREAGDDDSGPRRPGGLRVVDDGTAESLAPDADEEP